MKKRNLIRMIFVTSIIIIPIITISMNVQAYKDETNFGCHNKSNYTISANVSSIQSEPGALYALEIIATGTGVVIDVFPEALDNELFQISPATVIADGDAADINPATNAIEVILEITMPSSEGQYTLRILSRESSTSGTFDLWYLDLVVTVGKVITPPTSILDLTGFLIPILIIISIIILMSIVGLIIKKKRVKAVGQYSRPKSRNYHSSYGYSRSIPLPSRKTYSNGRISYSKGSGFSAQYPFRHIDSRRKESSSYQDNNQSAQLPSRYPHTRRISSQPKSFSSQMRASSFNQTKISQKSKKSLQNYDRSTSSSRRVKKRK